MADSFAKISLMLESARDITIEAAVSASTRLSETPTAKRPQEILKLLNSRTDREVLNGMICVISLIAKGEDASQYFAAVVKNVTLSLARVRALVLIYLLKHAQQQPDTALLLINSIQKQLSDKSPHTRSTSIKTLAGIKIPEIASLLLLCIKRTCSDSLAQVRSATALAIAKAYTIEGINKPLLFQMLSSLLGDHSPLVVASAVKVFYHLLSLLKKDSMKKIWAPIHGNFRRYCRMLPELDEWAQASLVDLLALYTRLFLPKPVISVDLLSEPIPLPDFSEFPDQYTTQVDQDLQLFLDALPPLVHSLSEAVIFSVARAYLLTATPSHFAESGLPGILAKMATSAPDTPTRLFALQLVARVARADSACFLLFFRKFYVYPNDEDRIAILKLSILPLLANESNAKQIIRELQFCALNPISGISVSKEAVKALGKCSQVSPAYSNAILKWCRLQISNRAAAQVIGKLLTVIRLLLQLKQASASESEKQDLVKTIYKLSVLVNDETIRLDPDAKATIIWLVGESTEAADNQIGPDLLRKFLQSQFVRESAKVRHQLLMLAAKAYLYEMARRDKAELDDSVLGKMVGYICQLARYDALYDTRDRLRMLEQLISGDNSELASLFLQVPKPPPSIDLQVSDHTSHILDNFLLSEPWADPETLPPRTIRKEKVVENAPKSIDSVSSALSKAAPSVSTHAISSDLFKNSKPARPIKLQSLDEFFGNSESEESEESEEEEEEEEEEQSEEEEEDDEEEEESSDSGLSDSDPEH